MTIIPTVTARIAFSTFSRTSRNLEYPLSMFDTSLCPSWRLSGIGSQCTDLVAPVGQIGEVGLRIAAEMLGKGGVVHIHKGDAFRGQLFLGGILPLQHLLTDLLAGIDGSLLQRWV